MPPSHTPHSSGMTSRAMKFRCTRRFLPARWDDRQFIGTRDANAVQATEYIDILWIRAYLRLVEAMASELENVPENYYV